MFYTKQDFAVAAIDAVTAFNDGDIEEADAAHKRMDEILREAANRRDRRLRVSAPILQTVGGLLSELEEMNRRQAG